MLSILMEKLFAVRSGNDVLHCPHRRRTTRNSQVLCGHVPARILIKLTVFAPCPHKLPSVEHSHAPAIPESRRVEPDGHRRGHRGPPIARSGPDRKLPRNEAGGRSPPDDPARCKPMKVQPKPTKEAKWGKLKPRCSSSFPSFPFVEN